MRNWWKRALALSLALSVGSYAMAGDPAETAPRRVIAVAGSRAPAASLDRPVPIAESAPRVDPALRPTSFTEAVPPSPVYRAQAPDDTAPKTGSGAPSVVIWRRHPETPAPVGGPPEPAGPAIIASTVPAPASVSTGTITPVVAGPIAALFHHDTAIGEGTCLDGAEGCGCGTEGCTFGNRFYATTDYVLWWIKGSKTPPLVTQGSSSSAIPGALNDPGTSVLFGGGSVENNPFSGGRFNVGYWFGDRHLLGIEAGGFFLGQSGRNFSATSFGSPILTRPIIDASTGMESTELVAGPNVLAGTVSVSTNSKMWGYEANLRSNIGCGQVCGCDFFVDGLLGFRGLGLDESLGIHESLVVIGGTTNTAAAAGERFEIDDRFRTTNRFYGGQIGTITEFRRGRWIFDLNTKIALGTTQEMVRIDGSTVITAPNGTSQTFAGGLLAGTTNIGRYTRDVFTWAPELGLNVGYQCTEHMRFFVGYNVLYWSSVARPGNQIDRTVNTSFLPPGTGTGAARPQFNFNSTDFWAQGVNFGLEFKY